MTRPDEAPHLELWAQYHTVGPNGYADSDGRPIDVPTPEAAQALLNHRDKPQDICWVNFSLFFGEDQDDFLKIGESIIAVKQQRVHSVRFQPVSEVIASGEIPPHTAKWVTNLALKGFETPQGCDEPDRFDELLVLAYRAGSLKRD